MCKWSKKVNELVFICNIICAHYMCYYNFENQKYDLQIFIGVLYQSILLCANKESLLLKTY